MRACQPNRTGRPMAAGVVVCLLLAGLAGGQTSAPAEAEAAERALREERAHHADALRALLKIDRERCTADLLAALETPSQDAVILRAAADGLVELKEPKAIEPLSKKLSGKLSPQERVAVIGALAQLKPDDAKLLEQLKDELGLDHFEGRTYPGWNRHVVLTAVAYTFLQQERRHTRGQPLTFPTVRALVCEVFTALYFAAHPKQLDYIIQLRRHLPLRI